MSGFRSSTQFGRRGKWRGRGRGRGRGGGHESPERPPKTSECATDKPAKTLRHSLTHGSSELCELYVGGPCYCSRLHHQKRAPYVWQYESLPDRWSFLSNEQTELVEQAFCNNKDETVVEIKRFGRIKETTVTFDEILDPPTRNSVNKFSFQRLSTRSYAEAGSDAISLYTQWVWYWKDNDAKWHPFLPPELQLTLETKYLAGQDTYLYTIGDQEYRLDFTSLVQVNRKYQTRRLVNRRPVFVSIDDARDHLNTCLLMSPATVKQTDVPPTWTPLDRYQNCEKVELETSTDEFTTVMSSIYKTLSANRCIVKHVCRLQNALLWHNYQSMKKTLQMAHGTEIIDQRQLFHGTDTLDVVNNICINNFDFRVSGKNATVFGKGAYFARDAKYSHSYTKGRRRYMFLARVLVGKYTLGDSSYTRPPPRKGHVLYDSCVNDEKNPSIFIIFERNQCYPEYLVEYKDGAVDEPSSVKIQPVRARAPPVASSKVQIINQTSSVQPIQAAPSPTKTLAAASRGNVFLNQNQTTSTSNTVSSSSSSNNQRQVNPWMGNTNASAAHTQSSVEDGAVDEPSSVKIQPVRARAPPVASSKVQIINQTSSVQPIQAAPSPTKTLAAASRGNVFLNQNQTTSTSNTVSSSSSSNNQRQVNPWMGNTNASAAHTQSSVEDGAVDEPSSVKIQPVRARAPPVASSKVQIINQTSSVQPIQAAPSPTKTLDAASRGNVFLNQNQTTSTSNTVSSSSSSNNQRQVNPWMGNTNASAAHTQSSVEDGAVDEPSSVKIQPVRARAPPVASSKVQIINQTSSVQPIQAAPSPTKTLAAASRGNVFLNQNQTTSTSNTVSSSSSSNNQRQVNPWMGNTNASAAHTQSSVEDGAVDEPSSVKIQPVRARAPPVASSKVQIINQTSSVQSIQAALSPTKTLAAASVEGGAVDKSRTSSRQDFSKAELALNKRSCAQSPYSPTKDTPAFGQSILSQKTSTNEGLSSKNEQEKEISSDSTMYTSTFKQSAASQKTSSNSGLSSWNNQHKIDNPRSSIKDTCAYGQSNAGLSSHQINDSDRMTKDLSAYGQSSISPKTNARVNSLNNQSHVYYKVRSTRGTASYVRAVDDDDMTANSATYRRFYITQQCDIPARQSSQMKGKKCIIM